jgi:hypothetical protein
MMERTGIDDGVARKRERKAWSQRFPIIVLGDGQPKRSTRDPQKLTNHASQDINK